MGKLPSEEESIELSSSERFQPREDDDQLLWEVTEIISEKRGFYKVRWKGNDPATDKPWSPSWVSKGDVTNDLVKKWKLAGKQTVKGTDTRQNAKSGKRGSTVSAATAQRSSSTRRSLSTAKASTPVTASTVTHRRAATTRLSIVPLDEMLPEDKPSKRNTPLSRVVAEEREATRQSSARSKKRERFKRKRGASVESEVSVPEIVTLPQDTPEERPAKKRRVLKASYAESNSSIEETESFGVLRPQVNGLALNKFDSEIEENDRRMVSGGKKLSKRARVEEEEEEEEEDPWDNVAIFASSPSNDAKSRHEALQGNKVIRIQRGVTKDKRKEERGKHHTSNSVTSRNESSLADIRSPNDVRSRKRSSKRLSRELSPNTLKRLKQFDAELTELEEQRKKQEAEVESIARRENVEDDEISDLEYYDEIPQPAPPTPPTGPPLLSSKPPNPSIAPKPIKHAAQHPPISNPKLNGKSVDDSYQGIVPETEPEDSSNNTQSQRPTQSQPPSHPAPFPPSMAVEPPASLRSRPSTPSRSTRPQASNSRSRSSGDVRSRHPFEATEETGFQPTSQDADVSAPLDMNEIESQEQHEQQPRSPRSSSKQKPLGPMSAIGPSQFVPYLQSTAVKPSALNGKRRSKGGGTGEPTSSIEQFSSPEKRARPNGVATEGKGKALEQNEAQDDTIESNSLRRRGQELAEDAFREKLRQKRLQAPKKPLAAIVTRKVQVARNNNAPKDGVRRPVPASSIETAVEPGITSSVVSDSEGGLADVPDDVVQQLEAAFVDLDGNANKRITDDTLEDESTSLHKITGQPPAAGASGALALRQEEEESSQDLLQEAIARARKEEDSSRRQGDEMQGDRDEQPTPPPPRSPEPQPGLTAQITPDAGGNDQPAQPSLTVPEGTSEKLETLLQREQQQNQALQDEIVFLRKALELAKAKGEQELQESGEAKATYDRHKEEWEAERASLASAAQAAAKAKEDTAKECEFFREQYARASAYVTSIREENQELERRANVAEDQAKSGVALIRATFENRIKELEQHVQKWQMMATFLIQKDQRTDNDELRRRAAEEPELRVRCQTLEDEINVLGAEIQRLLDDLEAREKVIRDLDYWRQEAEKLAAQLNDSRAEVERLTQTSAEGDLVYRCQWRTEDNKPCFEVFTDVEELAGHLFSTGHIQLD